MSAMEQLKNSTPDQDEQRELERVKGKLRRLRRAKRELDAEERPPVELPTIRSLSDRLAQPRPKTRWRIQGWQQIGHRVLLAAQFKAGKTTLVINIVRALLDGVPFLTITTSRRFGLSCCSISRWPRKHLGSWTTGTEKPASRTRTAYVSCP